MISCRYACPVMAGHEQEPVMVTAAGNRMYNLILRRHVLQETEIAREVIPAFVYRRYHRHERSGPQAVVDVHRDRGRYLRRTLGAGRSAGRADVDGQLSETGRPGDVLPGGQCQRRRRGHAGRSQPEAIQEADRGLYP